MPNKRITKLLTDVAQQFEDASTPMNHEWLAANDVTLDECGELCNHLSVIISGYVKAPKRIQTAVVVCHAADNADLAEHLVSVVERQTLTERLKRI